jgi:hypothetical protein
MEHQNSNEQSNESNGPFEKSSGFSNELDILIENYRTNINEYRNVLPCYFDLDFTKFYNCEMFKGNEVNVLWYINDAIISNIDSISSLIDNIHDLDLVDVQIVKDDIKDSEEQHRIGKIGIDEFIITVKYNCSRAYDICNKIVNKHKNNCAKCRTCSVEKCTDWLEYCKTCGKNSTAKYRITVEKCESCTKY